MTIIINEQMPQGVNHFIYKGQVQRGDRLVFQWKTYAQQESGPDVEAVQEAEVNVTNVQTEPGLMKGYSVVSWQDPQIAALTEELNKLKTK